MISHSASRISAPGVAVVVAMSLGATASAGGSNPTYVGTVTALSGTANVKIRATPQSTAVKAKVGTKIRLGATIVLGRGAKATLRLKRPATVPSKRALVYLKSTRSTKHTSTLTRDGKHVVVKIAPS